jgi:hypothetical protein
VPIPSIFDRWQRPRLECVAGEPCLGEEPLRGSTGLTAP